MLLSKKKRADPKFPKYKWFLVWERHGKLIRKITS